MKESGRKILPCPRCGEAVAWDETARWKPFCSERCKMIDLGAWFAEEHTIPGEPVDPLQPDKSGSNTSGGDD